MISKINKIKNLAVFKDFSWNDHLNNDRKFKHINIFYGRNYSGKTSLSRIFRFFEMKKLDEKYTNSEFELELNNGTVITQDELEHNELNIRVFNEDFIKKNFSIFYDSEGDIQPFAVLGENVGIEKEISKIKQELGSNIENNETGLYKKYIDAQNNYIEKYNLYLKQKNDLEAKLSRKATDREIGIKYKVDLYGDQNYNIQKLKKDIEVTENNYTSLSVDEKQQYQQLISQKKITECIEKKQKPILSLDSIITNANCLFSKNIASSNKIIELLQDAALNTWVKEGVKFNKDSRICKFCGNPISDERWKIIYAHFDEEYKKLENDINILKEQIGKEKLTISDWKFFDYRDVYTIFQDRCKNVEERYNNFVKAYITKLEEITQKCNDKLDKITSNISIDTIENNTETFEKIYEDYNSLVDDINDFSKNSDKEKIAAQTKLRLQEVYEYCIAIGYKATVNEISKNEQIAKEQKKIVDELKNKIEIYREELSQKQKLLKNEQGGAQKVNQYLNDYFGNKFLSLQAQENQDTKTVHFSIERNGAIAFNLSEGERRLIAFCYFIAKLEDIETKDIQPIIWIDDPISSLDSNHIYFIYSLIVAKIAKPFHFEQLFISTHNLEFLKYLNRLKAYKKIGDKNQEASKEYYLIERNMDISIITSMPKHLRQNATEFNYLFDKIYKCSTITEETDENYELRYNLPFYARKFFEIYLYYLYPDDRDEAEKLKIFFAPDEIPPILLNRINNEGAHGNIEKAMYCQPEAEAISVAKKIILELKKNEDQYNALLKSIENGVTNAGN